MFDFEISLLRITRKHRTLRQEEFHRLVKTVIVDADVRLERLKEKGMVTQLNGGVEQSPLQRILLAEDLVGNGCDPQKVARELGWQEFESFVGSAFQASDFRTVSHLVFKYLRGRREIDLLAWNGSLTLAIDCKHWTREAAGSDSRLRKAALAQTERVRALATRSDILRKHGVDNQRVRRLIPVLLMLHNSERQTVCGVPVVSVSKLTGFLYDAPPFGNDFTRIPIEFARDQTKLG